jgi:uncharacterized protein (TIGR01777 family)
MRVVVTGGSGFIGTRLTERLVAKGHETTVLTRDASRSHDYLHPKVKVVSWAPGAAWEQVVDGAGAIVNLAGENIAQRWTKRAKARILASRVAAADRLRAAVEKAADKPKVLVNASAVGYYGPHGDETLTEADGPGQGFLAGVCVAWEEAARRFELLGLRVARIRTGIVLDPHGGALQKMLPPFLARVGGPIGSGRQRMSWIHLDDLVDLYVFALENPDAAGAVNATAPQPVRNREFGKALHQALGHGFYVAAPVPEIAVKTLLGELSTVLLDGLRVAPKRATELGYPFRFRELLPALRDLVGP